MISIEDAGNAARFAGALQSVCLGARVRVSRRLHEVKGMRERATGTLQQCLQRCRGRCRGPSPSVPPGYAR